MLKLDINALYALFTSDKNHGLRIVYIHQWKEYLCGGFSSFRFGITGSSFWNLPMLICFGANCNVIVGNTDIKWKSEVIVEGCWDLTNDYWKYSNVSSGGDDDVG